MSRATSLLQAVRHILVQVRPVGDWGVEQVRPQRGDTCSVHVFLNGDEVRPNLADRQMLNLNTLVPTRLIDGLELHFGEDGPTFASDGCASLLFWSETLRSRVDRPFRGGIRGIVRSETPDTVLRVQISPGDVSKEPSGVGLFRFDGLLPGAYRLLFAGPEGPVTEQDVRVYAHRTSSVEVSIVSRTPSNGAR